jgi:hypothetical protein
VSGTKASTSIIKNGEMTPYISITENNTPPKYTISRPDQLLSDGDGIFEMTAESSVTNTSHSTVYNSRFSCLDNSYIKIVMEIQNDNLKDSPKNTSINISIVRNDDLIATLGNVDLARQSAVFSNPSTGTSIMSVSKITNTSGHLSVVMEELSPNQPFITLMTQAVAIIAFWFNAKAVFPQSQTFIL